MNLYGYVWNSPLKYTDPTGFNGWGNDTADYLDERIEYARQWYQGNEQDWVHNGLVNTGADLASGASDMLRVGSGLGHAIYDEDDNVYGRGANIAMDIVRGAGLFTLLGGPAARFNSACSTRTANPFKGKTPQEIDNMFRGKGFQPRGPDPVNGKGGYVNPKTNRSFHIDEKNSFGEPPHIDVNRPRNYKGGLPKMSINEIL